MKILFTGGGSGGHFYPIIAVAEKINEISRAQKILAPKLYFMSDSPYDQNLLNENQIEFVPNTAGKMRQYFSLLNIVDLFKTALGVFFALIKIFVIFPDVVFSKGAYNSFPVVLAARFFGIPIIIHESDSVPGRVNLWAGKFAKKVAISYPEAAQYFNKDKVALTGNPLRVGVEQTQTMDARDFLKLKINKPLLLILGGSLGSQKINNVVLDCLPQLISKVQIIHQTGKNNIDEVTKLSNLILENNPDKDDYHPAEYLNSLNLTMAGSTADLIISRAGSTIFEIANWGRPSIMIPITDSNGDHQRKNAYAYARAGATVVIEETNLASNVLLMEINRLIGSPESLAKMSENAKAFSKPDASEMIASEILRIGISHEE
jgi:UDP-N-acetylglucosamine--N-acetylmuramyl-(pentapeptide) pyrophosphoryl-undecaprenol N-acetylglucosamine transferase